MAKLVSVFISSRHRRLIGLAVWALTFGGIVVVLAWLAVQRSNDQMRIELRASTAEFNRIRDNLLSTFEAMRAGVTAEPCTQPFINQLRDIAFRPDGLNEFMYAPGGKVRCSIDKQFEQPVDLGPPDVASTSGKGIAVWMGRDLSFLGRNNLVGSIALAEPFATVVPSQGIKFAALGWMEMELVIRTGQGRWRHRAGSEGIYERAEKFGDTGALLRQGVLYGLHCDPHRTSCIAAEANVVAHIAQFPGAIAVVLLLAGLAASATTSQTRRMITRYWSFEARFRRHLNADSIVCVYQPVMALDSGEIIGCEVLARWRDVNDAIVFPDRFIHIVERDGLTKQLTGLVVRQAYKELSERLPAGLRFQVNFNIFPCDLDCAELLRIFSEFRSQPDRFDIVLEIVECNEFPEMAQQEIDALRRAGIKTYIDDFGTGYSNMQNLATLSVDGVKLDRSFAMAADDSLMARMLGHAVEMIQATGRVMVIEGIETAERLRLLREMAARIDHVQGYFISRPLDIAAFTEFLVQRSALHQRSEREAA